MAFKMKAGKEGPMKKNFPAAFKKESKSNTLPEVTVKDYETRARVLKKGYLEKGGKYYKKPMDPSFYAFGKDNEVPASEALDFKRKSRVSPDDKVLGKATKIGEVKKRETKEK